MGGFVGLKDWLGINALIEELRDERRGQREIMAQVLRTAEAQAQAVAQMSSTLTSLYKSYETDGTPPESRHLSEEKETEILEEAFYGISPDPTD